MGDIMINTIYAFVAVSLMASLSFFPVIYGETEREVPTELTIEIHMPNGIERIKRTVYTRDMENLSILLNGALEKLENLHIDEWSIQKKNDAKTIIHNTFIQLEGFGIITTNELTDILNLNILCLLYGHGKEIWRITIGIMIQSLLGLILIDRLGLIELLELYKETIIFSSIRPRMAIPFSICNIYDDMEVHSFGLLGYKHIEKWRGHGPYPPTLSFLGFTGLWINIGNKNEQANETWCIGSAILVI